MLFGLLPNPPLRPGGADRPRFAFIAESVCVPSARSHWEGVVGLTPVLPELTQHPRVAVRTTDRALGLRESAFWFFSPERTCQD